MSSGYEIEIFGEKIQYSEAKLLDIHLKLFFNVLEQKMKNEVGAMFDEAGSYFMLSVIPNTYIRNIYSKMYNAVFAYIKQILPLCNIKIEEIMLSEDNEYLWNKYKSWNKEIDERVEYLQVSMSLDRVPIDERDKVIEKYEKKSYNTMKEIYQSNVTRDIYNLLSHTEEVLARAGISIDIITKEDREKVLDISTFVFSYKRLTDEEKKPYILEILRLDPTNSALAENIMMAFPRQIDVFVKLFTDIGVPISEKLIDKVIEKIFNTSSHETEEDILEIKRILDNIPEKYKTIDSLTVIKINKLLADFDTQARSFMGIMFPTREIKQRAESQCIILNKRYDNIIESMSEVQCQNEKNWIREQCFVKEIEQIYIQKIDERIEKIWKGEDITKFNQLLKNVDIYSEESKELAKKIIQEIGKSEEKNLYIKALEGLNEEKINQYKKYIEWTKKSFLKKYGVALCIMIAGAVAMGIGGIWIGAIMLIIQGIRAKKMKDIWNLLTVNGRVIYEQLSE